MSQTTPDDIHQMEIRSRSYLSRMMDGEMSRMKQEWSTSMKSQWEAWADDVSHRMRHETRSVLDDVLQSKLARKILDSPDANTLMAEAAREAVTKYANKLQEVNAEQFHDILYVYVVCICRCDRDKLAENDGISNDHATHIDMLLNAKDNIEKVCDSDAHHDRHRAAHDCT